MNDEYEDKKSHYHALTSCLACGADTLVPVLDLGEQPLANSYHDNASTLPEFPLALNVCTTCFHAQQKVAVDPDLMFKQYAYVSGTSKTLRDYFDWFSHMVEDRFGKECAPSKKILDIACNDGSELVPFMNLGWKVWGVDPAENLLERSRATGAKIICAYWNADTARGIDEKFDVIVGQNVFAHNADPFDFLQTSRLVMHEKSKLLIQTSQANMFARGEFDTIYHEHISFFSLRSMQAIARRAGLAVESVMITPIHGDSYVFTLGFGEPDESVEKRLAEEAAQGRYKESTYTEFANNAKRIVADLKGALEKSRREGRALVGFGAAAKGNTLLNFGQITLDYIVDDNPLKQGLYTPGMNIPIRAPEQLKNEAAPATIVPLAWNFFDEIYAKAKALRTDTNDVFLTYFPSVTERQ